MLLDVLLVAGLALWAAIAVRYIFRQKKRGDCIGCSACNKCRDCTAAQSKKSGKPK